MRTPGSARFEPYFKLQWWDVRALAWRDIQVSYPTIASARAGATPGRRYRVMRVQMAGRAPIGEEFTR